ncbi:hypothetical protein ACFLQU_04805, partial [Verrucomicrobiota bacterium]
LVALTIPSCLHSSTGSPGASSLLDLKVAFPNQAFRMSSAVAIPTETLAVKFEHLNAAIRKQHPSITTGPLLISSHVTAFQVQGWDKQHSTSVPLSECTLRALLTLYGKAFGFTFREENGRIVIDTDNAPTMPSTRTR